MRLLPIRHEDIGVLSQVGIERSRRTFRSPTMKKSGDFIIFWAILPAGTNTWMLTCLGWALAQLHRYRMKAELA